MNLTAQCPFEDGKQHSLDDVLSYVNLGIENLKKKAKAINDVKAAIDRGEDPSELIKENFSSMVFYDAPYIDTNDIELIMEQFIND